MNPKLMTLIGILTGEASVLAMAHFTTSTGPRDILVPLIIRGAAMAFLFIPINQMVLGSFNGPELGQVAGMQNFFRQMGGSIGIASLDTLITRFSAQNYNDLLTHVNALNPAAYNTYVRGLGAPVSSLSSSVGLWNSTSFAARGIAGRMAQQVFVMSFEQLCFVIAVIVAAGLIPLALIKPLKHSGASRPMDAH
jgi:DHA2 family multidrug resistance protein